MSSEDDVIVIKAKDVADCIKGEGWLSEIPFTEKSINLTELCRQTFKNAKGINRTSADIYLRALADLLEAVVRHGSPQVRKGGKI